MGFSGEVCMVRRDIKLSFQCGKAYFETHFFLGCLSLSKDMKLGHKLKSLNQILVPNTKQKY